MAPQTSFDKALKMPKDELATWNTQWQAWMQKLGSSSVDMGAPLARVKTVTQNSITDSRNNIGAYMIVQADSHDEAAKLFSDSPHFMLEGGSIEVMEAVPMPGTQA